MPPGRIEDPPLALCTYPGPRLRVLPVLPDLQNGPIPFIVLVVNVGLVPAPKLRNTSDRRVIRGEGLGGHLARAVALELGADELDVSRGILEAEGGAVNR